MQDQGRVSTDDTLERNSLNVLTEENISDPAAPAPKGAEPNKGKSADPSPQDDTKPKRNRSREREVRRLRRDLAESESRNVEIGDKLSSLEQTVEDLVAAKDAPAKKPAPKLRDFDGDEKAFGEAYAAWSAEAAPKAKAKAKTPEKQPEKRPATYDDPFGDERKNLFDTGQERYGDEFAAAMSDKDPISISFVMRDYLFDNPEIGADVVMYLDEHRKEATKIANMGGQKAERAMEKIGKEVEANPPDRDGKITVVQNKDDEPKAKAKVRTKQPEPPDGVTTAPAGTIDPDMEKNTMDDYATQRRRQIKEQRLQGR